ncbi:MAG: SUMF1/EgtB/PvdO family nonheme iron enzyme [Anaerolineae bacterium]|nr:SUMF1/EgtB/PvdO family nonheme iron enzyme [Anaerolineae bacterium]
MIGPSNLAGQTLGNYKLYEPIGTGGMAVVYRGEQLTIQRPVAIKVLSANFALDPEFVRRFRREAETAARLEHAHIVTVYDFGSAGDVLYVVMRYLPGGSLAQRLRHFGVPALADTVYLLNQIASALDYAHKNGVIHRDIKPGNILLDDDGRAFLADFGIARLINSAGTTTFTAEIGTPAFMAPEQHIGKNVDARTDVYALGVMLYVMTVGQLPFEADSQAGVAYQHINVPPTPPIEINPKLPQTVSDVILRALAKSPDDRPSTPGALAAAFESAVGKTSALTDYFVRPLPSSPAAYAPPVGPVSEPPPTDPPVSKPISVPPAPSIYDEKRPLLQTRPSQTGARRIVSLSLIAVVVIALIGLLSLGAGLVIPRLTQATPTSGTPLATDDSTVEARVVTATVLPTIPTIPPTNTPPITATLVPTLPPTQIPATVTLIISLTPAPPTATFTAGRFRVDRRGVSQVWVPAGCFLMGSDPGQDASAQADEMPQHQVCVTQGYWLDQYEVTNAAYQQFIDDGGYRNRAYWSAEGWDWLTAKQITGPQEFSFFNSPEQPRVGISWYEADAYARWRGGRLPTEAEWEYATRGPDSRLYPWGNAYQNGYANIDESAIGGQKVGRSAAVGSYDNGKSWVNAYDLIGNVWEWVNDWYDANYYQQRVKDDPTGPTSGTARGLRGGSYFNDQLCARAACRRVRFRGRSPDSRDDAIGIRVVSSANSPAGVPVGVGTPGSVPPETATALWCPNLLPSRIAVGRQARVTPGKPNRLRDNPALSGNLITTMPAEEVVKVLEGPRCTPDGIVWWKVDYQGTIGWTAEGQANFYYLEPWPPGAGQ